ncbi:MAG: SPOR domain-containing protein [Nitrosomonas sp.]|nr:SPOR domain-containing protein [Nitrosomonas sp.]MDP1949498.1 SPOR domain-containing protein [Nitrosomonas sp.]
MAMNISEEELLLRKRARRRLLGAITLVILAVLILPMIFDDELKLELEQHEIAIHMPSGAAISDYSPTLLDSDKLPLINTYKEVAPAEQLPIQPLGGSGIDKNQIDKPVKQNLTPIPQNKPHFNKRVIEAKSEIETKSITPTNSNPQTPVTEFVVQLGAFSDHSKARQQQQNLVTNGIRSYTEILRIDNKEIMRVRVGPFSTRRAAEVELVKLKQLGFTGVVTAK